MILELKKYINEHLVHYINRFWDKEIICKIRTYITKFSINDFLTDIKKYMNDIIVFN